MEDEGRAIGGSPGATNEQQRVEQELVRRLRAGDEAAFVAVVTSLTPGLLRMARLHCPAEFAEEVVQDTWLAVVSGLDRFEGRSTLRSWIVGILLNVARTRSRRERKRGATSWIGGGDDSTVSVDPARFRPAGDPSAGHWLSYPERWDELPESAWQSKEATEEIRAAISRLPAAQRRVVTLRDVLGWPAAEVAAALGLSAANERVLLHRGRARVRTALEAYAARARRGVEQRGPRP